MSLAKLPARLANRFTFAHAEGMPRTATLVTLTKVFDQSSRPIYVVDAERRIVYCNPALAKWLDIEVSRIVGRLVEYHSEPASGQSVERDVETPLNELSPPPRALLGEGCVGTISCLARAGSLSHRRAEFVPLDEMTGPVNSTSNSRRPRAGAVLALVAARDLTPAELSSTLSGDPPADEMHRVIRQFRRSQAATFAIESLLGDSAAMRKVRAQVAAAAASGAHCLICGPRGSGRAHVARAIHYYASSDPVSKLIPVDCRLASEDLLRRALDAVVAQPGDVRYRPTLLLENLECLAAVHQAQLLTALQQSSFPARVVATMRSRHAGYPLGGAVADVTTPDRGRGDTSDDGSSDGTRTSASEASAPATFDPTLLDIISTITIHIRPLWARLDDLPILTQCILESCNHGSDKQIGSVRREALDLLALYSWPGELDELSSVISAAHRACSSHEISPVDLPPIIHHGVQAACHPPRRSERIVLDELLVTIEKEAIMRAMVAARGNKTEAADLLGMTRPRLYRRLVQLGLVTQPVFSELEAPEFIEQESPENAS